MRRLTAVLLGLPLALFLGWAIAPTDAATTVVASSSPFAPPRVQFNDLTPAPPPRSFHPNLAAREEVRVATRNEERWYAAAERNVQTVKPARSKPKVTTPKPQAAKNTEKPEPTGDIWWALAGCETGRKWDNPNTGNGYYGYFQFSDATFHSVGGEGHASDYSYDVQLDYAKKLQARSGWGQWPYCSRKLGLR